MTRTADHAARRRQIVDAFAEVAVSAGFDAVSLPRIADRAGVSVGLVQRYFASKDDLLVHAVSELFERLRDRVRVAASPGPVRDQLLAALTTLLPLDDQRMGEAGVWLAVSVRARALPRLAQLQAAGNAELRGACVAALELARQRGETRGTVDPRRDGAALAAFVDGLWWHMVNDPVALPADHAVAMLAAHLDRLLTRAGKGTHDADRV